MLSPAPIPVTHANCRTPPPYRQSQCGCLRKKPLPVFGSVRGRSSYRPHPGLRGPADCGSVKDVTFDDSESIVGSFEPVRFAGQRGHSRPSSRAWSTRQRPIPRVAPIIAIFMVGHLLWLPIQSWPHQKPSGRVSILHPVDQATKPLLPSQPS